MSFIVILNFNENPLEVTVECNIASSCYIYVHKYIKYQHQLATEGMMLWPKSIWKHSSGASWRRWPEPLLLTSHGHHDITSADYTLRRSVYRKEGWLVVDGLAGWRAGWLAGWHPSGARLRYHAIDHVGFINTFKFIRSMSDDVDGNDDRMGKIEFA